MEGERMKDVITKSRNGESTKRQDLDYCDFEEKSVEALERHEGARPF